VDTQESVVKDCPLNSKAGKQAILVFELPEYEEDFRRASNVQALSRTFGEYTDWLRQVCKYQDPKAVDATACRTKLYEIATENGALDLF